MKFEEIKIIFLVSKGATDKLLSFLFDQGVLRSELDFDLAFKEFKKAKCLLMQSDNLKVEKLLEELDNHSKFIYFIGCEELLYQIDPFAHYTFCGKGMFKYFEDTVKSVFNKTFKQLINEG